MSPKASSRPRYAELLVEARNGLGWSQAKVAEALGVSRSYYANAENGRAGPGVFTRLNDVFAESIADEIRHAWHEANGTPETDDSDDEMLERNRRGPVLEGTWHALWQTTVEGEENFNFEVVTARWVKKDRLEICNSEPSPDNPKGGYIWTADLKLFDNCYLLGHYLPTDPVVRSKGTLFLVLHRSGKFLRGIWTGCNYDEDLASGRCVIAKERSIASDQLKRDLDRSTLPLVE